MTSAEGTPQDEGGQGEISALADSHHERAGFKTLGRAVRERWPIPPERRQRILTVLQQIVETDTFEVEKTETESGPNGEGQSSRKVGSISMPNHRNQVAAAKVLLAAAKLDQDDQHHVEGHVVHDRQHGEKILADASRPQNPAGVRILIVNERGAERSVNLREFYDGTVIDGGAGSSSVLDPAATAVPLPAADAARPGPEQGR